MRAFGLVIILSALAATIALPALSAGGAAAGAGGWSALPRTASTTSGLESRSRQVSRLSQPSTLTNARAERLPWGVRLASLGLLSLACGVLALLRRRQGNFRQPQYLRAA